MPPEATAAARAAVRRSSAALLVLTALCGPVVAADFELLNAAVRVRVGGQRVLGAEQPERFLGYDASASWRLPWERYPASGWGIGTRLMLSAGAMQGAGRTAVVLSALPVLAFGSRDGRYAVDLGAGLALLSRHDFGRQDYGGPLQFALTFGVGIPLYRRIGLGYRFMHYSDAALYSSHTIGADFHMIELSYWF